MGLPGGRVTMLGSYWAGVAAALAAGTAFNIGVLVQKLAIMKMPHDGSLMRRVIRNPLWLAGFALQFLVGVPLNVLAQAMIGPAMLPGLMAIGLIPLAIGAARLAGEKLNAGEVAGIALVMAAVTSFGLSRMSIDVRSIDLYDTAFILRLGLFTASVAALSSACHALQKANRRMRGILRILNAGLLFSQSNLWLGILMALPARWSSGRFSAADLLYAATATGIVLAGSILGISETQHALSCGNVSRLVPIQYFPSQVLPIAAYFLVFLLRPESAISTALALAGIALVILGAILLARRQVVNQEVQAHEG